MLSLDVCPDDNGTIDGASCDEVVERTSALDWNASTSEVEDALEALLSCAT